MTSCTIVLDVIRFQFNNSQLPLAVLHSSFFINITLVCFVVGVLKHRKSKCYEWNSMPKCIPYNFTVMKSIYTILNVYQQQSQLHVSSLFLSFFFFRKTSINMWTGIKSKIKWKIYPNERSKLIWFSHHNNSTSNIGK